MFGSIWLMKNVLNMYIKRDTIHNVNIGGGSMAKSETLHIRVESDVKAGVEATLKTLGLSTTEAINIFLHQVILVGGLPFEVKNPQYNAETLAAIQEARDIIAGKVPAKSYNTVAELMEDLNSEDDKHNLSLQKRI